MRINLLAAIGIGVFCICSCAKVIHQTGTEAQVYRMEHDLDSNLDTSITSLIAPYQSTLATEMDGIVGNCPKRLDKSQPESTLGNWMADAFHAKAETYFGIPIDLAIQNYGGIRVPYLPKGDITKGNIFELMPFENRMVVLQLKGAVLQTFLSHIATLGGWPISQSVLFEIKDGAAQGVHINNKPLVESQIYTVALPDYIANGGDNCSFLENYVARTESERLIRDALLEYIAEFPIIDANIEGRVVLMED